MLSDERTPEQRARDAQWEHAFRQWVEAQPWADEWRNVPCMPEAVAEILDGIKEQEEQLRQRLSSTRSP